MPPTFRMEIGRTIKWIIFIYLVDLSVAYFGLYAYLRRDRFTQRLTLNIHQIHRYIGVYAEIFY